MDREPKERVIFDESVYYGDAGEEIAIESLMASEDLTEAEVRAAFIDSQIFERAMEMMDRDRTVELEGLSAFFDGDKSDQSSFVNPLGGNRIIARGSVGRWDGTSHGLTAYRDFDDMMRGADSVFKDCEIGKVWDENGSLFVHGYHHDGGVDVELRQLTDAGEEALDAIEDAWVGEEFTIAGKTYDGSAQSTMDALDDLWENPALCPAPHYMELAFGCPAEEWEEPTLDPLLAIAEFTPSAIMSAEVASGVVSATVLDISGTPYTVPVDVLKGLKDAVRSAECAATVTAYSALTIAEWNQKGDESRWALDFEDRNGFTDASFAREHRRVLLQTPDERREFEVQAADCIGGWEAQKRTRFESEADFSQWYADRLVESDMRLTDEAVASPIVTLCTCSYNRWADNERTVVYAAPIGAEKSASENPQVDGSL